MVSTRCRKRRLRDEIITANIMRGDDFSFLDVDTSDAASALTHLRLINDIQESPDHVDAMKYLKRVQVETNGKEYISFVGVLKEFQEEVVREINAKKDYVIKCALTLFQGHTDLILTLGGYIPEILDTLEVEHPHEVAQKRRQEEPTTGDAMEWQQECLLNQTASDSENVPNIASGWQQEQVPSDEAIENFMINVRKRFQHSDQTVYMKISRLLCEFLVDMTMPVHTAKVEMAALLRGHNDLRKEFERFLPPELRAGPSSHAGASNPR